MKYLTVSGTDSSSNKEREIQDVGDEDIMYKSLLDNTAVETLVNEDDFEIDTGSRDRLHGLNQEDPILKTRGGWRHRKDHGPQREEQVDGCLWLKVKVNCCCDNERSCHLQQWPRGN